MINIGLTFFGYLLLNICIAGVIIIFLYFLMRRKNRRESTRLSVLVKKGVQRPIFMLLVVVFAVVLTFCSISSISLDEMGTGEFFVESILPLTYWVGISTIVGTTFFMMRFLENKHFRLLFIFSSILLMTCIRMVFPLTFTSIPAFEPDVSIYINVVNSWINSGADLGYEGNYHHDYPLSFILAYVFTKFGVSVEAFFRYAPFFVYAIDLFLVYKLTAEVSSDSRYGAVSAFLLSFSSLNYWMSVHYCPDLVGTLFYLLSLYLVYMFVKKGEMNIRTLLPVLLSIFMLILSHHLSILYFVITLFGLSFAAWFLKSPLKGKERWFLLFGVYAYTLWFVYGSFMYPSFFNVYVYFQGFTSPSSLAQQASLLDNATFAVYPLFIFALFSLGLLKLFEVKNLSDVVGLPKKFWKLRSGEIRVPEMLTYSLGFIFVAFLFLAGFVIPATFPLRVLEVLLVGVYPLSSQLVVKSTSGNPSRKKTILMLVILMVVVMMGVHRYYRQIQRRVLFPS